MWNPFKNKKRKPICFHYWTIDWALNESSQIMRCVHCGETHQMKKR